MILNFKLKWVHLMLICFSIGMCTSCLDNDESKDWSEIVNLYVASETEDYYPQEYPDGEEPLEGIKIKEHPDDEWTVIHINDIVGFVYERGFEYHLKVEKVHLGNPPADGRDVVYKLIEIISRE